MLIVHAHEAPKSFNGALKGTAVRVLKEAGHKGEVSDLAELRAPEVEPPFAWTKVEKR